MNLRLVALIALWTLISGPIFGVPTGPASSKSKPVEKIARPADVKTASPQ